LVFSVFLSLWVSIFFGDFLVLVLACLLARLEVAIVGRGFVFFWQICLAIITVRAGGFSPYWAVAVQRIDVPLCEQPSFPTSPWYFFVFLSYFGHRKVIKYRKLCASATVAAIKSGAESRSRSLGSVWAVAWHLTPF